MNRPPFTPATAFGLAVLPLLALFLLLVGMASAGAQTQHPPMAPGLTSGVPDNCEGSASGGLATGMFGLSFGFTSPREDCNRRADARVLAAIGDRAAAEERLCESPQIRAARLRTGRPCAADGGAPASPAPAAPPPPRAGELAVRPIDVCSTLGPSERRAYKGVCRRS